MYNIFPSKCQYRSKGVMQFNLQKFFLFWNNLPALIKLGARIFYLVLLTGCLYNLDSCYDIAGTKTVSILFCPLHNQELYHHIPMVHFL